MRATNAPHLPFPDTFPPPSTPYGSDGTCRLRMPLVPESQKEPGSLSHPFPFPSSAPVFSHIARDGTIQKKYAHPKVCVYVAFGGDKGSRTPDLLNAIQALYQLSYAPTRTAYAFYHIRTV